MEINESHKFYSHPNNANILVNRNGDVHDVLRGVTRYREVLMARDKGNTSYTSVIIGGEKFLAHRLVAETFIPLPPELAGKKIVLNHINGIKKDNRAENLEWTTYSGNIIHAFQTGLRTDITPLLVKNVETDEVTRFESINACARGLGINPGNVFARLNSSKFMLLNDKYVLIREGEEWPSYDLDDDRIYSSAGNILYHDKVSGDYTIFETAGQLADAVNLSQAWVSKNLSRARNQKEVWVDRETFRFCKLFQFKGQLTGNETLVQRRPYAKGFDVARNPRKPDKLKVTNLKTSEVRYCDSTAALAEELGTTYVALRRLLFRNKGNWRNELLVEKIK